MTARMTTFNYSKAKIKMDQQPLHWFVENMFSHHKKEGKKNNKRK